LIAENDAERIHWRFATRLAFRFAFCYLMLYCLYIFSDEQILFQYLISGRLTDSFTAPLWHHLVPWVGKHVLHLSTYITIFSNGSGDTAYDYVLILCELFLAAVATVIWSALDRKRPSYRVLYEWLRFVVRLALATEMLVYGMDKLIPVQFGALDLGTLSTRVGDLSPASLLWTFMAASKPYTIFAGFGEVLAGVLLLVPQLATLGSLVTIGVMANVFALNMSYDVPVKLASFHYLVMAAFLVLPDTQRLLNVLVLNRTAAPRAPVPLSSRRWINQGALILSALLGIVLLASLTHFSLQRYVIENPTAAARSPLYGVWTVDEFTLSAKPSRPLFTDKFVADMNIAPGEDRWTALIIDTPRGSAIGLSNGALDYVTLNLDAANDTLSVSDPSDPNWKCNFVYRRTSEQLLNLEGAINGNPVSLRLHRSERSSRLMSRGFHWINEFPFF
jgi:uncharacterized membrane protein YphA (DoxX/SURF4 family)